MSAGSVPHAACLGLLLAGAVAPPQQAPTASPPADGAGVHVTIETFAIDRKGTWSAGSDEADLFPGTPGVLEKSVTLVGKDKNRTQDKVTIKARLTPEAGPRQEAGCVLRAVFETRRGAGRPDDTPIDRREAVVTLAAGEERLVDVYASPLIAGRVAMRVSCSPSRSEAKSQPDMVTLDVSVQKDAEGEPAEILRSQRLVASLGHEAGTVVTANATLPDAEDGSKRYRRAQIDAALTPLLIVAGKLQIDVHVTGEIATFGTGGKMVSYPIDHSETFIVAPSEPRSFKVEITARGPDEGWKQVTLTIGVIARF